jgi:hypothetical protein
MPNDRQKVSAVPATPTMFDGDRAGFHATMLVRLLCIRTQAAIVLCVALYSVAWVVASLCRLVSSVLVAWVSH